VSAGGERPGHAVRDDAGGNDAVISYGSNIDAQANVARAIEAIASAGACGLVARSRPVWTKPVGFADQPDFLNGAVRIETTLNLDDLRAFLREIEHRLGRVRTANEFGPRTIDLDVVVWNGRVIDDDFHTRDFLRLAVLEVFPDVATK
jgi:2-amino-4-hydroxy-6-hydroxymethyldihydropteridine diphosphokinase